MISTIYNPTGGRIAWLVSLLCLLATTLLGAQPTEPSRIDTEFRFYLVGVADGDRSLFYLDEHGPSSAFEFYIMGENETPELVSVKPGETSSLLRYQGRREFSIYRSVGVDPFGQPRLEAIYTVNLPEAWGGGMLTIIRGKGGLRVFPLNRQLSPVTENTALLVNVGSLPVLCQAMDEMFPLEPYESKSISLASVKSDFQLNLKCAIRPVGEWQLVYSGSQTVLKGEYYIFLLIPNEHNNNYRLVRFRGER